jgi:23S rRNA (adenine2503-C2)-methyltransferase
LTNLTVMISLYDATRADFETAFVDAPRYRIDQLWNGLYSQFLEPHDITTLPATVRTQLDDTFKPALEPTVRTTADDGKTIKFLWRLADGGHPIETVLMYYDDRATVCVSTQAGCAMACGFCATGQAGFNRHLTAGEIIEQVARACREARKLDRRVDNIVFMGMGEPLANEPAVWAAVERIHGDIGISARHLTISTVGIIPGIRALAARPLPVNLAVSLHAARNELRDELVPINKRYPIEELIAACRDYLKVKNRRISFEWALIEGVNDTMRDAKELHALCRQLTPTAHVNLIPLNPTPGWPTKGSSRNRVHVFRDTLLEFGTNVTIRSNRGTDIAAACGQLAAGQPVRITPVVPSRTSRTPSID